MVSKWKEEREKKKGWGQRKSDIILHNEVFAGCIRNSSGGSASVSVSVNVLIQRFEQNKSIMRSEINPDTHQDACRQPLFSETQGKEITGAGEDKWRRRKHLFRHGGLYYWALQSSWMHWTKMRWRWRRVSKLETKLQRQDSDNQTRKPITNVQHCT